MFGQKFLYINLGVSEIKSDDMYLALEVNSAGQVILLLNHEVEFLKDWSRLFINDVEYIDDELYKNLKYIYRKKAKDYDL
jgi:hypothetical protein